MGAAKQQTQQVVVFCGACEQIQREKYTFLALFLELLLQHIGRFWLRATPRCLSEHAHASTM